MASIREKPGSRFPFRFADFSGADGKRRRKSGGTTDGRLYLPMAVDKQESPINVKRGVSFQRPLLLNPRIKGDLVAPGSRTKRLAEMRLPANSRGSRSRCSSGTQT